MKLYSKARKSHFGSIVRDDNIVGFTPRIRQTLIINQSSVVACALIQRVDPQFIKPFSV